jgi:hypothetical protein
VYIALAGEHDWFPPREYGPVATERRTSPRITPHPDGGVTLQWVEDTDPAPVEPPPLPSEQEAQLAAAGLEGAAAGRQISAAFRRILNARKDKP